MLHLPAHGQESNGVSGSVKTYDETNPRCESCQYQFLRESLTKATRCKECGKVVCVGCEEAFHLRGICDRGDPVEYLSDRFNDFVGRELDQLSTFLTGVETSMVLLRYQRDALLEDRGGCNGPKGHLWGVKLCVDECQLCEAERRPDGSILSTEEAG